MSRIRNSKARVTNRQALTLSLIHILVLATMNCLTHGCTQVMVERFDPLLVLASVHKERCTDVYKRQELERYTHLYYDLSINIAGIDAIHHMLERIELLQQEVRSLRNELEFYR